jgi:hypothetical protein
MWRLCIKKSAGYTLVGLKTFDRREPQAFIMIYCPNPFERGTAISMSAFVSTQLSRGSRQLGARPRGSDSASLPYGIRIFDIVIAARRKFQRF